MSQYSGRCSSLLLVLLALALVCQLGQQVDGCISKESARIRIRRYLQLYPDLASEFASTNTNPSTSTSASTNSNGGTVTAATVSQ